MRPESLPLDRKDFFREKKHERAETQANTSSRWRDFRRCPAGEPRRIPGLYKQGSHQVSPEEPGSGCTTSQSGEKTSEVDCGRSFLPRTQGRYEKGCVSVRSENKSAFGGHRHWKSGRHHVRSWDLNGNEESSLLNLFGDRKLPNAPARVQRSVDDLFPPQFSHTHSDVESVSWDESPFKDQHDKLIGMDDSSPGRMNEIENSLGSAGWKGLKWTRSGSVLNHSSASGHPKSNQSESDEAKLGSLPVKETLERSFSGDATEGLMPSEPVEDLRSQKKQRLGWGQGLAKYEKQKVDCSDDASARNGSDRCASNTKSVDVSGILCLPYKSAKYPSTLECMSPATPSSMACSSSSGLDERSNIKINNDHEDAIRCSDSMNQEFQQYTDELFASEDHLYCINSLLVNLSSLETGSGDFDSAQSTAMNKLILLKNDISKLLEKTECEIDLFESELKFLDFELKSNYSPANALEQAHDGALLKPTQKQAEYAPNLDGKEQIPCVIPLELNAVKDDDDIDSPGTVTSKCCGLAPIQHGLIASSGEKSHQCAVGMELSNPVMPGRLCAAPFVGKETAATLCCDEDGMGKSIIVDDLRTESTGCQNDENDGFLRELVLAKNKELAKNAWQVFDEASPSTKYQLHVGRENNNLSSWDGDINIQEKLMKKWQFQKFKERALTLKFRALRKLWIEDLQLLSLRKIKAKSQKRFELSCHASQNGCYKHRVPIHSRSASAGNLALVPTVQTADFAGSKLLSDSQVRHCRDNLKMPALILDDHRRSQFMTNNGLIEDPCAVEKERAMINPWMPEEKEIFMEKLAMLGKDFSKIASFLSHKTTADCIEFYYKNHKSESFEEVKKTWELKKQSRSCPTNAYMLTSGKKWSRDCNAAAKMDGLGADSAVALDSNVNQAGLLHTGAISFGGCAPPGNNVKLERTSVSNLLGNDSDAAAADVLASICGGLSSEAVSSCITSSVDLWDGSQEWKGQRCQSIAADKTFTPYVSENVDEETFSDDSCGELQSADWTDEEKSSFIVALKTHGKDFASISDFVRTRTMDQCKIFFSKARKCLSLDLIHQEPDAEETRMSDATGGKSDNEDAFVTEMDSAICSMQSCSKIDVELPSSVPNQSAEMGIEENNLQVVKLDRSKSVDMQIDAGMKEHKVVHSDVDRSWEFGSELKRRVDYSDKLKGELQVDALAAFDVAMDCKMLVPQSDEVDGMLDQVKKVYGTEQTSLLNEDNGCNHITTQVQSKSGNSMSCAVEMEKQCMRSPCDVESRQGARDVVIEAEVPKSDAVAVNICSALSKHSPLTKPSKSSLQDVNPGYTLSDRLCQRSMELIPTVQSTQAVLAWQQNCNCSLGSSANSAIASCNCLCQQRRRISVSMDQGDMHHCEVDCSGDHRESLSCQALSGRLLQNLNEKDRTDHADPIDYGLVQKLSDTNRDIQSSEASMQDKFDVSTCSMQSIQSTLLEKYDVSRSSNSEIEPSFLPSNCKVSEISRNFNQPENRAVVSNIETEMRTGDVKLFGQILSKLSPLQKVNSLREKNENAILAKSNQPVRILDHEEGAAQNRSKLEARGLFGNQEFPGSIYSLCEGSSRMHNGLSASVSSMPTAVNNFALPICQVGPQSLSAILRRNDQVLGRALGYPNNDFSGNSGSVNHQSYQRFEGPNLKPYSFDTKRQDQNGFEAVLGFQRGNAMVGMSSVGGVISFGNCTDVSDAVVSIKKRFASEVRSVSQAGLTREDDSWSGDASR